MGAVTQNLVAREVPLAEALARLQVAVEVRDADAAVRILGGLTLGDDGAWLARCWWSAVLARAAEDAAP